MKQILAMDINREYYELGLPVIEKAGVAHKIDFREGPALPLLDQLIKDVSSINPCKLFSGKTKNQCVYKFMVFVDECVLYCMNRKRTREASISSSLMLIKITTWTIIIGWLSLWRSGEWSPTITPCGTALWSPHPMLLSWIILNIIVILWWSWIRHLHLIQGSRFASFPLVTALPCAAASFDHSAPFTRNLRENTSFYYVT